MLVKKDIPIEKNRIMDFFENVPYLEIEIKEYVLNIFREKCDAPSV